MHVCPREDLEHIREELRCIDDAREAHDGVFGGHIDKEDPSATVIPPGQAECSDELAACYAVVTKLKDMPASAMPASTQELLRQLTGVRAFLEKAIDAKDVTYEVRRLNAQAVVHAAPTDSLRVAPLQDIQRHGGMLDAIDNERQAHGGIFVGDLKEGRIPPGQAVLSGLLARCYDLLDQAKRAKEV